MDFWHALAAFLKDHRRVFAAFVVAHTRHSPGTTGARLLVADRGETLGTIGGGAMEHEIIERGRRVLRSDDGFKPAIPTLHHRKNGAGEKSGMICAGSQTNLYYLFLPERHTNTVAHVARLVHDDRPGLVRLGPEGMRIIENEIDLAQPQIRFEQLGAVDWLYEEQLLNLKRIAILGGGHCALALSHVMKLLRFEVFVFDTRRQLATLEKNHYARSTIIVDDFIDAGPMIGYPETTMAVVMTRDYPADIRSLLGIIELPLPFIGIMGSEAKIARIKQGLSQAGVGEKKIAKLRAPVGLPIPSHTPEEIAISIAAQILQEGERLLQSTLADDD